MNRKNLYLSTIDPQAHILAREYGLGIEIAEFCTAYHMDERFLQTDPIVRDKLQCSDRFVLHGPFNELFPCAIDPKARELAAYRYLQAIDLALRYGAKKVVFHGGYNPGAYYPVWYEEQSVLFWRDFLKHIPDGITVCLENVLEDEPEMLANIIRAVDSPKVKMCLDVGHANAYSRVPVQDWLKRCGNSISHFHIHNNHGDWDTHNALNDGTIPMEDLLLSAQCLCPDATYTLELQDAAGSVRWLLDKEGR